MSYKYTIIETHSNKNIDDHSSVLLHDAVVQSVRYENGDFILSMESIIVMPNREPNETDRFLSTGQAEIRIHDTVIPDGYPMDAVDYDLDSCKYNLKTGVYQLYAFIPAEECHSIRAGFRFPCKSVTYSFDEFTGDSWIQQSRDHQRQNLERFIEMGHGGAWRMLKGMHPSVRDEYVDLILKAAVKDQRLDIQCDEPRTEYVMDLLSLYDEKGVKNTREHILNILMLQSWRSAWTNAVTPDDFAHSVNMILANRNHPLAEETLAYLENHLNELYDSIEDKDSNEADWVERKREYLGRALGKLPPEELPEPTQCPQIPEYTMDDIIEMCRTAEANVHPMRFRKYFDESCTAEDIEKLLSTARNEENRTSRGRMYSMFAKIDFPGEPDEIISMAREFECNLGLGYPGYLTAMNLQRAVSRLRSQAVRAYRDELLAKAKTEPDEAKREALTAHAIEHWVNNYTYSEESDAALADLLHSLPEDRYGLRHHTAFQLTNSRMYDEPQDPHAYSHLVELIYDTHCPNCRRKAAEILRKYDKLSARIAEDLLHDSDSQTRKLAEERLKEI